MHRTLFIALALTPAALADPPFFMGMGDLPGGEYESWAGAISGDGQVVFGHSKGNLGAQDAVRWTCSSGLVSIGGINLPGLGFDSWTYGANFDGSAAVGHGSVHASGLEAFRWTSAAGMERLGSLDPNAVWSFAYGISDDAQIVAGDSLTILGIEAVRWTQAGIQGLGDLEGGEYHSRAWDITPDGSILVGLVTTEEGEQAAYWTEAQGWVPLGDLPGGEFESHAWAISADGSTIVGRARSEASGRRYEGFRWTAARGMEPIGFLPGGVSHSWASAVSADGSVIAGEGHYGSGRSTAMVWTAQHGARDLRIVLETEYGLDLSGWFLESATGISDDGKTIVGIGFSPRGREGFIAHLGTPCYANFHNPKPCDATLDILDYLAFQDAFIAADPRACDCDTTTGQATCDIFDFLCFQDAFAAGCQ